METQVAQIQYNTHSIDITRDILTGEILVEFNKQTKRISSEEQIHHTLRNLFQPDLVFEILDLLFYKESGIPTNSTDHEKAIILDSKWSSHCVPFQLFLT
jgi:hypothetical protein